jgi:hypothetical protein
MCFRALNHINVAPDDFENRFYTTKTLLGREVRVFVAMHITDTPNLLCLVRDP